MKIYIGIGAVILLVIGGIWFLSSSSDEPEQTVNDTTSTQTTQDTVATTQSEVAQVADASTDRYIDYNDDNFANTANTNRVIFFHASWCPNCLYFEKVIQENQIPDNLTILKADYDSSFDLKRLYGVTYQSTLVAVDENGDFLDSWHTSQAPTIADVVNRLGI